MRDIPFTFYLFLLEIKNMKKSHAWLRINSKRGLKCSKLTTQSYRSDRVQSLGSPVAKLKNETLRIEILKKKQNLIYEDSTSLHQKYPLLSSLLGNIYTCMIPLIILILSMLSISKKMKSNWLRSSLQDFSQFLCSEKPHMSPRYSNGSIESWCLLNKNSYIIIQYQESFHRAYLFHIKRKPKWSQK